LEVLEIGQTPWLGRGRDRLELLRDEVAVGDVGIANAFSAFGAHELADALNFLLILSLEALGVIPETKGLGGVIAVFLEGLDFLRQATLDFDELGVFLRFGDKLTNEVGPEQDSG
jgi:hypothetical protein